MNDNRPGLIPGHELTCPDGLPRPPTAEAVAHYSRFTQIDSFPTHPDGPAQDLSEPPAMDVLPERPHLPLLTAKTRVTLSCIGSFLLHFSILAIFLTTLVATPEDAQEEAGDTISVVMLGSSDSDQMAAGDENKQPQPEQVQAEAVQPDTVQPNEAQPTGAEAVQPQPVDTPPVETAEAVQPQQQIETQPMQATETARPTSETVEATQPQQQAVQQVSPETVVSPEPEVLATRSQADTTVIQPMSTAEVQPTTSSEPVQMQPVETEAVITAQPTEVQPTEVQSAQVVQAVEPPTETTQSTVPPAEVVKPTEKPVQQAKPVEKPKDVERKQLAKVTKAKSGANGEGEVNSKKGSADGDEMAQSNETSQANVHGSSFGSAERSNYLGKINSCIQRASHFISGGFKGGQTVTVRLTILASGQIESPKVTRSSGNSDLDGATVAAIRRVGSCPPIPEEAGRASWVFTAPVLIR